MVGEKVKKRQRGGIAAAGDDLDDFGFELADWQDEDGNEAEIGGPAASLAPEEQKASKKRRRKKRKADDEAVVDIANGDSKEQSEWLRGSYKKTMGADGDGEESFSEHAIAALDKSLSFEKRLLTFKKSWNKELLDSSSAKPGSPLVICIAGSAGQANNLVKELPTINKACRIAKLFAKHFKVNEQQQMLRSQVNVASGTPNRLCKLVDDGSLKLSRLQLIVLDVAKDAKQRTLVDIPEVCGDLWQFIEKHVSPRLASKECKIGLIDSSRL